jgi:small subunit ribosomal protein S20
LEVQLPNTLSAKKRVRQTEKRTAHNKAIRNRARTFVKSARQAIEVGDEEIARDAVQRAASVLDRAASKGVIHARNAARRKSRLMKHLEAAFPSD